MTQKKYFCSCCNYNTFIKPTGSEEVCEICGWEDCLIQYLNPKNPSGLNPITLEEAQQNFKEFSACCKEMLCEVRKVTSKDVRKA